MYSVAVEQIHDNAEIFAAREASVCLDNELATAAAAGDEDAFRQLYERHCQAVTRLAFRFFPRREQAEEMVQEAFTKAYFALPGFRGVHERSFISWLLQISTRVCYDALRRPQHRAEQIVSELSEDENDFLQRRLAQLSDGRTTEDELMTRDLAGKLLARLSPDDRLVLTLLHGEEQSSADIAMLTGWSEGKVRVRALRARRSLQRVMQKFL